MNRTGSSDSIVAPESLRPVRLDVTHSPAKKVAEQATKVFEKSGVQPRTQSAELFARDHSCKEQSASIPPVSDLSMQNGNESSSDQLIVLETTKGVRDTEAIRQQAQNDASQIVDEWGSEFPADLDVEALETALTKYNSYSIEGLVSTASDFPPDMRTAWLNDRLEQLNKTGDIPGMTELADRLTDDFAVPTQQGTAFELDWIAAHADQIQSVGLETADRIDGEGRVHGLKQGVDVLLKDGTAVELKCYDFSRLSYHKGAGVEGPLRQLERDISKQRFSHVKLVFDTSFGDMPEAYQRRLDAGIEKLKASHPSVVINDVETWRRTR